MRLISLCLLFGCREAESDKFSTVPDGSAAEPSSELDTQNDTDEPIAELDAEEAFRVPERPWDLALGSDNLIYCSTQGGNKVYVYDPITQERTQFSVALPDVQNLWLDDSDTLYFTRTDHGVTGSLSVVAGNRTEDLITQADDGTLMRWPMDIVEAPDSTNNSLSWVIADFGAGLLFFIQPNGDVTVHDAGSNKPQSLLFVDDTLYIGGEDGIFRMNWPAGTPEQIDDRSGLALEWVDGKVWSSNADSGVFVVEDDSVGLNQAARPAVYSTQCRVSSSPITLVKGFGSILAQSRGGYDLFAHSSAALFSGRTHHRTITL